MELGVGIMFEIASKENFIKVKRWVWKKFTCIVQRHIGVKFSINPVQFISGHLWPCTSDTSRIVYNINVWLIQCFVIFYDVPTYSKVSITTLHYSWIYANRQLYHSECFIHATLGLRFRVRSWLDQLKWLLSMLNTLNPTTVHQPRALVSCIQPGLVICFTLGNIHVSMLFSRNIPPSPSPAESKSLFCTSVSLFLFALSFSIYFYDCNFLLYHYLVSFIF